MQIPAILRFFQRLTILFGALGLQWTFAQSLQPQTNPGPQLNLPRTTLQAGMYRMDVQVAATAPARQIGLMHRREMPQHEGMLFIFERPAVQCFWMRNTLLALTAAFIDDNGTITHLADMQPLDETSHCSTQPVRFVLEMHQGWFARKGLRVGSRITGAPFKTAAPSAPASAPAPTGH